MDLNLNLVKAIDAIQVEERQMYAEYDPTLLSRILELGRDIFDFVHPHEWFFEKFTSSNFRLSGMLAKNATLVIEVTATQTDACIIQKKGSLTERLCSMTLHPETWTDMVGWFSWARNTYEGSDRDKVYLTIVNQHWKRSGGFTTAGNGVVLTNIKGELPAEIILKPDTRLETNYCQSSVRLIDHNSQPISQWIHPRIHTYRNETLTWVTNNMHTGKFTITSQDHVTSDPDPDIAKPLIGNPVSNYQGYGSKVGFSVHVDPAVDTILGILGAAIPLKKAPDPMKNFGKGKPDLVAEMFDLLESNPPKKPKPIKQGIKKNTDPIPGLEDFF